MTAQPNTVPPIPEGTSTVMPWIISRDTARLLDFMKQAFGAQELTRLQNEDGTITHAEVKIGNSIVGAFNTRERWPETPCFLRLYVEDADAVYQQALAAGAVAVTEMTSLVWGERGGRVRDPVGNIWWIQAQVEQVSQEEIAKRLTEQSYLNAVQYTRESLDREMRSLGHQQSR
ncbi:MAG TPA: VOC family protein [Ktedonobacteraceae bacterium]|nr:VOC family protein [Ktedonobacteraceae bacterium]